VATPAGLIDLLTNSELIEIKSVKSWKMTDNATFTSYLVANEGEVPVGRTQAHR